MTNRTPKQAKTAKPRTPRSAKSAKSAAGAERTAKTDRLRKAALAEINARIDANAGEASTDNSPANAQHTDASPGTAPKPSARRGGTKPGKPKRVSALDAAAAVLAESATPMRAVDLIAEMQNRGLWRSPGGRTPEATLYAAIIREIAAKGESARFKKHARGLFTAGQR